MAFSPFPRSPAANAAGQERLWFASDEAPADFEVLDPQPVEGGGEIAIEPPEYSIDEETVDGSVSVEEGGEIAVEPPEYSIDEETVDGSVSVEGGGEIAVEPPEYSIDPVGEVGFNTPNHCETCDAQVIDADPLANMPAQGLTGQPRTERAEAPARQAGSRFGQERGGDGDSMPGTSIGFSQRTPIGLGCCTER
ncbi:hypothetical protein [Paracoccus sp. (in: a-proteobacteria)]|uniref:hypothetical protein n=1 Tax=Paracoccus sp. TaxID=267 RepID=UPI003A8847AE